MAAMTLKDFTARLSTAFGADLAALVLYGSAVGRGDEASRGARNLLVIVRALRPDALRRAATDVGAWQAQGERAPLILTESEWRSSRDVFAIEHADIGARHEVLAGALPAATTPAVDDLRRQLEYEAMGALIHLRQGILACAGNRTHEAELLRATKGTVFALLRAVLRLSGAAVPAGDSALAGAAARIAGFDVAPFEAVAAHAAGVTPLAPTAVDGVLSGYHDGLKRLVAWVDAQVHPDAPAVD